MSSRDLLCFKEDFLPWLLSNFPQPDSIARSAIENVGHEGCMRKTAVQAQVRVTGSVEETTQSRDVHCR